MSEIVYKEGDLVFCTASGTELSRLGIDEDFDKNTLMTIIALSNGNKARCKLPNGDCISWVPFKFLTYGSEIDINTAMQYVHKCKNLSKITGGEKGFTVQIEQMPSTKRKFDEYVSACFTVAETSQKKIRRIVAKTDTCTFPPCRTETK